MLTRRIGFAETAEGHLAGSHSALWLNRLQRENHNLRAVLSWLGKQPEASHDHLRLAAALAQFWVTRGHYYAGRQ